MTANTRASIVEGILQREQAGDPAKGYLSPNDRGGRTTWGISEKAHPEAWKNGPPTREQAASLYDRVYVQPWVWVESDTLAEQLVDCTVLHGYATAVKLLQCTLGIAEDGIAGPTTQRYTCAQVSAYRHIHNALVAFRLKLIDDLTDHDTRQKVNEEGWENRALSFLR